jgi:glycosidase
MAPVTSLPTGSAGYPWWNDSVFYQVFVRSFYDSDGEGIGDLKGLIARLDYLNDGDPGTTTDLGVTGLWLLPIHPAASYHGYDVTDYFAVNPQYGTLDDFKQLLAEAHARGIRILIDLVLNHTSSQHPWFVASQNEQSPFRDWYVWSPSDPGQAGWHVSTSGGYYYGFFWEGMPDLNYTNPDVTDQMQAVVRFWLQDVGVDGFRLDAAKYLIEEGTLVQNSEPTHDWYHNFRLFYKNLDPQALTVGEIWDISPTAAEYTAGDQLDLAFDFDLAKSLIVGLRTGRAHEVASMLSRDHALFQAGQYATFLTNHDMNRVMSQLAANEDKARLGATLLLTAPGVPFIYYGEEIGMLGKKPDEDIRTPMQWSADANGGFTRGQPWRAVNPDYAERNVALQSADPASLLSHYRALIQLRNRHAALRVGDLAIVQSDQPSVFASLRSTPDEAVLIVANLGAEAVSDVRLSLASGPLQANGVYRAAPMLGAGPFADLTANAQGGFDSYTPSQTLAPLSNLIVQLQRDR